MNQLIFALFAGLTSTTLAQTSSGVTIPATNGSLPAAGDNGCAPGFSPGRDETIVTLPYTYQQVLSIIGNYTNLTWSGNPDGTVTTNASASTLQSNNWQPGDARMYNNSGAYIIETLTVYMKDPSNQRYTEVHTLAPIRVDADGIVLTAYASFDGQDWTPTCGGKAMIGNFTTVFCADDLNLAGPLFHEVHMADGLTVGKFLGGQNFTSCDALGGTNSTSNGTTTSGSPGTPTPTTTPPVTGGAERMNMGIVPAIVAVMIGLVTLA